MEVIKRLTSTRVTIVLVFLSLFQQILLINIDSAQRDNCPGKAIVPELRSIHHPIQAFLDKFNAQI